MSGRIKEFWNSRANLGLKAGTQDLILKELEYQAISNYVSDGMTILDAGCGNGLTAIRLAKQYKVNIIGIDFSSKMIEAAKELAKGQKIKFIVGDITENIPEFKGKFDLVYTERAIVNLEDWATQNLVIELLATYLKPSGLYLMCECSQNALNRINDVRVEIDLPEIIRPWHNRYLYDEEIPFVGGFTLIGVEDFSSTYYFLSRVVNAYLARLENREPDYNSAVNQLALKLPPLISGFGQVKLWIWRRNI